MAKVAKEGLEEVEKVKIEEKEEEKEEGTKVGTEEVEAHMR